jgi:hypothetical protein
MVEDQNVEAAAFNVESGNCLPTFMEQVLDTVERVLRENALK